MMYCRQSPIEKEYGSWKQVSIATCLRFEEEHFLNKELSLASLKGCFLVIGYQKANFRSQSIVLMSLEDLHWCPYKTIVFEMWLGRVLLF